MYWNVLAGRPIPQFRDADVLSDYSAQTGYDPRDPRTDQGTDMAAAADYFRKTGIIDATGYRHRVDISVTLRPTIEEIALAAYLFGSVSLGIRLPSSAEDQFDRAEPWGVVAGSTNEGGHDITVVGRNSRDNLLVVTWGRLQAVEPDFVLAFIDEAIVHLSVEQLRVNDKSRRGYDETALMAAINKL